VQSHQDDPAKGPMVDVIIVGSSARCDMCGSKYLVFNSAKNSKLYLCKFHNEQLSDALKLTEP
jgi:hypothetical protein